MKTISKILALSLLLSFFVTIPIAQAEVLQPEALLYETASTGQTKSYLAYHDKTGRRGSSWPGQFVDFETPQKITKAAFYIDSINTPDRSQPLVKDVTLHVSSAPLYSPGRVFMVLPLILTTLLVLTQLMGIG